jgi:hypothetical protein
MDLVNMYGDLNKYMENPMAILVITVILVVFFILSVSLGSGTSSNSNGSSFTLDGTNSSSISSGNSNNNIGSIFVPIIILTLVILLVVNVLYYVYNIDVLKNIRSYFGIDEKDMNDLDDEKDMTNLEKDTKLLGKEPAPATELSMQSNKSKKQVFNIPGNYYTYDNAKALCSAYGAELATYKQIEDAYNNGGEWCNYGWSADQLALFPTQKSTYDELQTKPGRGNDCGRPGVNGGFIDNPNVRFGVNCYGEKPNMTSEEYHLMQTMPPYPQTAEEIAFQKQVDTLKSNLDKILVSPFNRNSWNEA